MVEGEFTSETERERERHKALGSARRVKPREMHYGGLTTTATFNAAAIHCTHTPRQPDRPEQCVRVCV